jgi:HEAT repeat protein
LKRKSRWQVVAEEAEEINSYFKDCSTMLDDNEAKQIENYIKNRIDKLVDKYQSSSNQYLSEDSKEFDQLIENLYSQNMAIQCQAALTLGNVGNTSAIVPLAKTYYVYERSQQGYFYYLPNIVRITTAAALYKLGEYFELSDILSSPYGYIRPWIKKALDETDDGVIQILIQAITDSNVQSTDLPYWCARALGYLKDKQAIQPLITLLNHQSADTRVAAIESLGQIGDSNAIEALQFAKNTDHSKSSWKFTVSEIADRSIHQIESNLD